MPTIDEAEAALEAWKSATGQRDELVRAAHEVGVSKYRITQITGITRPTVDRILKAQPAVQENLTAYLAGFTAQWPKAQPGGMTRLPGIANIYDAAQIAALLLADPAFRALRLGTWLSLPTAEALAGGIAALRPPLLPPDARLLADALAIAARRQQEDARAKLAAGLLGGAALAFVIGTS
jgi:hypothetical protein